MSDARACTSFERQFTNPPEPPERGTHAWLFVDGGIRLTRVVGRATVRVEGRELPATSCVLDGRVTILPTDRLIAIPEPDPYAMPTEPLP
ncbi:MAG: hypothetical protein WAS21_27950 [Geminicoccaceae bacterium]